METKLINLEMSNIDSIIVKKIPEQIAVDNCLIAFKEDNEYLYVAISNEPDILIIEELKFISGRKIKTFYAEKSKIANAINNYYCKSNVKSAIEDIEVKNQHKANERKSEFLEYIDEEEFKEAPAIKLSNSLINGAIHQNASDIHIEPFQDHVLIRYRIDGIISEFTSLPKSAYNLLCTRLKIMASMDIAEKRMPQDGKIRHTFKDKNYDLRISTLPTVYGEKIAVRILYRSSEMKSLSILGFSEKDVKVVKSMIHRPNGIIIVTGPTGSGKTTTLYSMLNAMDKVKKNITSIEDPVEYTLSNVNQVNVNAKIGFTFAEGLRSILRQDPDVIMVGEIGDEETAQIAIRAAITGHLVISTLHTNDAAETVLRFEDMGIPRYFISDAIVGIIAQRLIRVICPHCRESYNATQYEKVQLNLSLQDELYKGCGCWQCNGTGYKGRTVIYEIMEMKNFRSCIKNEDSIGDIREYCLKNGMSSMKKNCIELVKKGITTYEEFLRINI